MFYSSLFRPARVAISADRGWRLRAPDNLIRKARRLYKRIVSGGVAGSEGQERVNGVGGGIGVGGGNGDGNGDVNGHGDEDGAGTGTEVEVNEGAPDGNGDGSGDVMEKVMFIGKIDLIFYSKTHIPATLYDVSFGAESGVQSLFVTCCTRKPTNNIA